MPADKKPPLELTIDGLAGGGEGVGRSADGCVVFVPDTAPGDCVHVELVKKKKRYARGRLVRILQPGDSRTEPRCPVFGSCGGCQWQHIDYSVQLSQKEQLVRHRLARLCDVSTIRTIIGARDPYGYRQRIRLRFSVGKHHRALGYYAKQSHRVVDTTECAIAAPLIQQTLATVRSQLLPALKGEGVIELLAGEQVALRIELQPNAEFSLDDPRALLDDRLVGLVVLKANRVVSQAGRLQLALEAGPKPLMAEVGAFIQSNQATNLELIGAVCSLIDAVSARQQALDLYAGIGNFSRPLRSRFASVLAVEQTPRAVEFLRRNCVDVDAVCADVVEYLAGQTTAPDLILCDPPRVGMKPALPHLIRLAAPAIIYVSCDLHTFARDCEILAETGYRLKSVQPIDMFPQTSHLELVALLTRDQSAH